MHVPTTIALALLPAAVLAAPAAKPDCSVITYRCALTPWGEQLWTGGNAPGCGDNRSLPNGWKLVPHGNKCVAKDKPATCVSTSYTCANSPDQLHPTVFRNECIPPTWYQVSCRGAPGMPGGPKI